MAPETSLRAIPWKRREVPNKVAEEGGGMKGGEASFPDDGAQWGGCSSLHGHLWGPWAATGELD